MKHRRLLPALLSGLLLAASAAGCTGGADPSPGVPPAASATDAQTAPVETSAPTAPGESAPPDTAETGPNTPPAPSVACRLRALTYPDEALQAVAPEERDAFLSRAAGGASYEGNRHRTGTSITYSPYYTATAERNLLPVYATPVMVAEGGERGVWHSFAAVDVDFGEEGSMTIQLQTDASLAPRSAEVFSADNAAVVLEGHVITLTVSRHGVYTLLLDDSQETAVTLFVRPYVDEEAEIAALRDSLGADRVTVYEPGLHITDPIYIAGSDNVLYLRAGAVLLPRHAMDIMSDAAASDTAEAGAQAENELGLNRRPVINAHRAENIRIAGRGTVDMTEMDWHERRGVVFSLCNRVSVEGLLLINPAEWSLITYRCEDVDIRDCGVLGYRTNSDAFAVCNSKRVTVADCFARTGDDMFEVKCLGGPEDAVSEDIRFSRCQAWGSKARAFGIIGEMEKDISNVLFEDGIVIWRDAVWDNNRLGSLVILRESGTGTVTNVTFRRMLIHRDEGRAINCTVYNSALTDTCAENIRFEDVTYTAELPCQVMAGEASNRLQIICKNVKHGGTLVTRKNLPRHIDYDRSGLVTVEE